MQRIDEGVVDRDHGPGAHLPRNLHGLADEEAHGLPIEARAHDRAAVVAVRRHREIIGDLNGGRRIERALDDETIIALAEHQIDDLDGALRRIGAELAVRTDADLAEADAAREEARFAEGRIAGDPEAEAQIIGHVEAGQRRLRHDAVDIFLAGVVEDVEDIDLLRFRRLGADGDQEVVRFTRQFQAVFQRTVSARRAAFNSQRSAQLREIMSRSREDLHAFARDGDVVVVIRLQDDRLLDIVVPRIERRDRRGAQHLDARKRAADRQQSSVLRSDLDRGILGVVLAANDRDLEVADNVVGGVEDTDPLAFQEAIGEPAVRIVGKAGDRHPIGGRAVLDDRMELDIAREGAIAGEVREDDIGKLAAGTERPVNLDELAVDRVDCGDVIVTAVAAGVADADLLADEEAFIDEAAEIGARAAGNLAVEAVIAEDKVAVENLRRPEPADHRIARAGCDGDAVDADDIRQPVGDDRDLYGGAGRLRQPDRVVVRVAAIGIEQSRAAAFEHDGAGRVVVNDFDVDIAGAGAQVREDIVVVGVSRQNVVALEVDDRRMRIFARDIVTRLNADANRVIPVGMVEG
ncbi:hypothetical protein D9M68_361950 [compost metagenome]